MDWLEITREFLRYITRDKNVLHVFCVNHIEDFLITGGLCHALLKKKRKQSCVLICSDRFKHYGLNFVDVAEIRGLSPNALDMLLRYCTETGDYEGDNYIYSAPFGKVKGRDGVYRYRYERGFSFLNRIRVTALNLPVYTELLPPLMEPVTEEQKQRLHETYTLDKNRTIILVPYATIMRSLEETFWTNLIAELKRKNSDYVFYTNVATPDEKVIDGTEPIETTFSELMYIAEKVNCFIGLRCGPFDLLALTNARLLCINNDTNWWHFDLNLNYKHANGRAFYIGIREEKYIRAFMEKNNIPSLAELPLYNHVKGTDIFFDMDSMSKAIVDSVDVVAENSDEAEKPMDWLDSAYALLQDLTRDKDVLHVFCVNHIGDVLITGGLCHALMKKKGKQSCVLILYDRFKDYNLSFVDVAEIRAISSQNMNILMKYCVETGEYEGDNYVYAYWHKVKTENGQFRVIADLSLCFLDRLKKNIFDLPLDTKLHPPVINPITDDQKQRLHETYVLDKKRTIIFAPYVNATKNLEETLWIKLVEELKQKSNDYVFYTNVAAPNEKVIEGTAPIVTTFPELMYVAENVNCFIGLRSGLFDLLALTNVRLLYVNKTPGWWYYDLNINYNHTNSRGFYIAIREQAQIQAFMAENNIASLDKLPLYNHVKGTDIFFDMDSLRKAIVDSVDVPATNPDKAEKPMNWLDTARKLLQDLTRDKNVLHVFCVNHIGDFLLTGGLCHALLKKKRKQSCVLICGDRFKNCNLSFVDVAEIRAIPPKDLDILLRYCTETGDYEGDNYIYSAPFGKVKGIDGEYRHRYGQWSAFTDRIKLTALNLPLDTKLLPPLITPVTEEQKQRLHETYTLDKNRTIILVTYALSNVNLEETFWTNLIAELKRKNSDYVFYTNVAISTEKVIDGTEPIVTTFPELMYIAENVKCFIGLRNGLFDLLALTNARLLYINYYTSWWWHFNLNLNYNHTNSRAFYNSIREQEKIQAFMSENNIPSLDKLPLYNHVKGTDIFFDMDSLRKAIVDSVD